jgi:hypothetical protein
MRNRKTVVTVIGAIGAVLALASMISCMTLPPVDFKVVDFTLDNPNRPTKILVNPHVLEGLHVNDVVVFNNKTGMQVKVTFGTAVGSPFKDVVMTIPGGSGSPYAQAESIVVNPKNPTDYRYLVTSDDISSGEEPDQSPVIRVGPKPSRTEE